MNKKLFCLASLAALALAGCGETPEPGPGPDPEPVDPTVADLQARFVALGESYKAVVTLPADGEDPEFSFDVLVNANYAYADELLAVAKFASGKYYLVEPTFDETTFEVNGFEADWGVVYGSAEEYAQEVFLKNQSFDASSWGYNKSKEAFKAGGAIASAINDSLLLSFFDLASTNLLAKLDEDGTKINLEFYSSAAFSKIAYTVSLAPTTETAEALETWVAAQENDPSAPFTATALFATFYRYKNYTAEIPYGGGIYEHEYVTLNSKTIARDEGWKEAGYGDYAYTMTYANFGKGKMLPEGLYAYKSYNVDVEKDLADFYAGTNGPTQVGTAEDQSFWVTPGYVNPVTFYYYLVRYGVNYEEIYGEYGQAFRITPESTWADDGTVIGLDYVASFAEYLNVASLYEEGKYAGYDFESIDYLDICVEFTEEGYLDNIITLLSGVASYKDKDGTVKEEATPYQSYTVFYDFGVTVDPYGAQFIGLFGANAQAVALDVEVEVGQTAPVQLQTLYIDGTEAVVFADGSTENDYAKIEATTDEEGNVSYTVTGKAGTAEPITVYVVINGAAVTSFTITVAVPSPDTFAGYWVNGDLVFELDAEGHGTYSDGTNEFTVEFDPATGKITGGTFVSVAGFDADDSFFSWNGQNLVCNYSQDYGEYTFTKEFTAAEKPAEDAGLVGRWVSEGFTIVLNADGTGTYSDGTNEFTIEYNAETGVITGGTILGIWDAEGASTLTLQDGKLNVHLEDEYQENVVNKVFTRA